jgi:uncharacterized membrane protein
MTDDKAPQPSSAATPGQGEGSSTTTPPSSNAPSSSGGGSSTPAASQAQGAPVYVAGAAISDEHGTTAEGVVAAQEDHAILVAQFADTTTAQAMYENLRRGESGGGYHVDGVLVVNADQNGKVHVQEMTDHKTRNGLAWGAVAGVVLGVIFPPSILGSAVVLGATGAALGKARNLLEKGKVADAVAGVVGPGTSGILALVHLGDVPAIEKDLTGAKAVTAVPVDDATAKAIKEAAAATEAPAAGDATATEAPATGDATAPHAQP